MTSTYHRQTRIERHRAHVSWAATIPFLVAFAGALLYFFETGVSCWIAFTMVASGLTVGGICMGLSHSRLALFPILYQWREPPHQLCVIVNHGGLWDRTLDRPLTWQRVLRLVPGIYLLQGEPFAAHVDKLVRHTYIFHSDPNEFDDETDEKH